MHCRRPLSHLFLFNQADHADPLGLWKLTHVHGGNGGSLNEETGILFLSRMDLNEAVDSVGPGPVAVPTHFPYMVMSRGSNLLP